MLTNGLDSFPSHLHDPIQQFANRMQETPRRQQQEEKPPHRRNQVPFSAKEGPWRKHQHQEESRWQRDQVSQCTQEGLRPQHHEERSRQHQHELSHSVLQQRQQQHQPQLSHVEARQLFEPSEVTPAIHTRKAVTRRLQFPPVQQEIERGSLQCKKGVVAAILSCASHRRVDCLLLPVVLQCGSCSGITADAKRHEEMWLRREPPTVAAVHPMMWPPSPRSLRRHQATMAVAPTASTPVEPMPCHHCGARQLASTSLHPDSLEVVRPHSRSVSPLLAEQNNREQHRAEQHHEGRPGSEHTATRQQQVGQVCYHSPCCMLQD